MKHFLNFDTCLHVDSSVVHLMKVFGIQSFVVQSHGLQHLHVAVEQFSELLVTTDFSSVTNTIKKMFECLFSFILDIDKCSLYRKVVLTWLRLFYQESSLVCEKLIMLRMGKHSQVVFYNKMWSILNYLRNVVAQMVIRYSQNAQHQKIFMFLTGFRNKFIDDKAFSKAETLFCLYYTWSPFE